MRPEVDVRLEASIRVWATAMVMALRPFAENNFDVGR